MRKSMPTILTVDPDPKHFKDLTACLSKSMDGVHIIHIEKVSDIPDQIKLHAPDAILIDLIHFQETDFEASDPDFKQTKKNHIPILVISNRAVSPRVHRQVFFHGASALLEMPICEAEFTSRVNAFIRLGKQTKRFQEETETLKMELKKRDRALKARSHDLDKRIRELNCLYAISELRENTDISLDELLQGVADLIPPSTGNPESTCARIILGYQEFKTKNFRETPWKASFGIQVHGEWAGTLEVYRLEEPKTGKNFFPREETSLCHAVAERLARIAERVQAEDSLRFESENISKILRSMEDLVYIVNGYHTIEYVNPALEKAFGPADGKKCYQYFRNRKAPCSRCRIEDVLKGNTVRRERVFPGKRQTYDVMETPIRNPDGTISKLAIYRDVTALKRAQRALEEREALYRSVTESIADGAVMVRDGKVLFVNHALVEMFEYDHPKDLAGIDVVLLFDPDFRELFRRVFDPQEKDAHVETLLRGLCVSRNGKKFWVATNRSVIELKSRPVILVTMRDITEDILQEKSVQEVTEYLQKENIKLRSSIKERYRFGNIIGKSLPMQQVYELILKAASSKASVIVLGESGTGKELVARAIHDMSDCAEGPFVPVNCGAVPENLVESEFFGHRKGAFTSAHIDKNGYLSSANGGTLFLDEVGDLGLNLQVKLLRAIETGEYTPVGDTQMRKSRIRIISATNRDFSGLVSKGQVREDFYYRISVIPISLPPLREKKEDIALLVDYFLQGYAKGKKVPNISGKIMESLYNYDWPGNVRELQSVIQRYLAVGNFEFMRQKDAALKTEDMGTYLPAGDSDLKSAVRDFEKQYILSLLKRNRWHRGKVADALGIDPKTLYTKMKNCGIS